MKVGNSFCALMVVIMTMCNAKAFWPLQKTEQGIVNNEPSTHDFFGSLAQFRVPDFANMQIDVKELPESIEIQVMKVHIAAFYQIPSPSKISLFQ